MLHPGSWKGMTRDEGLKLAAESIERAIDGLPGREPTFSILIENTAGAECSLGGNFEQVAELVAAAEERTRRWASASTLAIRMFRDTTL